MIITCKCTSDRNGNEQSAKYQDSIYGKFRRVATLSAGNKLVRVARCTICGCEQQVGKSDTKKEE